MPWRIVKTPKRIDTAITTDGTFFKWTITLICIDKNSKESNEEVLDGCSVSMYDSFMDMSRVAECLWEKWLKKQRGG